MNKDNVQSLLEWFQGKIADEPPEGKWIGRRILNERCKEMDVPLSYLESHGFISICKDACYLRKVS